MFFRYYIRMRRNLKQFLTILVLLMGTLKVYADDFTLRGKVVDEEEHALELVTVSCPAQGKVTMTNLKGEVLDDWLCPAETRVQESEETAEGSDRDAPDEGIAGGDGDAAAQTDWSDTTTGRQRYETDALYYR